jgi:transposase InsO family protein
MLLDQSFLAEMIWEAKALGGMLNVRQPLGTMALEQLHRTFRSAWVPAHGLKRLRDHSGLRLPSSHFSQILYRCSFRGMLCELAPI